MLVKLDAELIMEVHVDCPERLVVGDTDFGFLRVIPIIGGFFSGKLNGKVIPVGADWNNSLGEGRMENKASCQVFAKYLLQTNDGVYIAIENLGYRDKSKMEPTIKTTPSFHAPKGKYEWLNYGVYVGSLAPSTVNDVAGVDLKIYKML